MSREIVINHSTLTVNQLQQLVEQDKAALARDIHDVLGGYLIATAMDLSLLRRRLPVTDPGSLATIERATQSLNEAVDMMRRVTEELHPTLLDNVGLFSALRWQIKNMCHRSNLVCSENFPDVEPRLSAATSISLFRVGQEALVVAENHPEVTAVAFTMSLQGDALVMEVCADGAARTGVATGRGFIALEFLRHRIDGMAGTVTIGHPPAGGVTLLARICLDSLSENDTRSVRILDMVTNPARSG